MKTKFWALCGVMLSGLCCVSDLSGVEYTWNGETGDWGTAANWTPNTGTPGSGDTAIITAGTVNSLSGDRSGLTIQLSGGTLKTSNHVAFLGNSLVEITGTGNFNSSHQIQPRGGSKILVNGADTLFNATHVQIAHDSDGDGTFEVRDGTVTVSGFFNVGNRSVGTGYYIQSGGTVNGTSTGVCMYLGRGSNDNSPYTTGVAEISGGTLDLKGRLALGNTTASTGLLTISGGVVKVGELSMGSNTSKITFLQNSGNALTYRDGAGNLVAGITNSGTAATLQYYGTIAVDVEGIQFADSDTIYTLIDGGVSAAPKNTSSNLYDLTILDGDLNASLKNDLPSEGAFGALEPTGDSLILYTNLEGDLFNDLLGWLDEKNESLAVTEGTSPSSLVLSLLDMGDVNSLIWDLSAFNTEFGANAMLYQPSQVPEPATWWLLLFGTVFFLKKSLFTPVARKT